MSANYLQLLRFYPRLGAQHDCRCGPGQAWDKPTFRLLTPVNRLPGISLKVPRSTVDADRLRDLFACILILSYPDGSEVEGYSAPSETFRILSDEQYYYIVANEQEIGGLLEDGKTYCLHIGGAELDTGYWSEPFTAVDCDCLTRIELGHTAALGDVPYQTNFHQVFYTREKLCDGEPETVTQKQSSSAGDKVTYQRQTKFKRLDLGSVPDYVVDVLVALPMHQSVLITTPAETFEVLPGRASVEITGDTCCYSDLTLLLPERQTELRAAAGCETGSGTDLTEQVTTNPGVCTNAAIWTPADLTIFDQGPSVLPALPSVPAPPLPIPAYGSFVSESSVSTDCLAPFIKDGVPYTTKTTKVYANGIGGTYTAEGFSGDCQGAGGGEIILPEVDSSVSLGEIVLRVGQTASVELVPPGLFRAVDGQTLIVTASGLPAGLVLGGRTITGKPTSEGDFDVRLLATLSGGGKSVVRRKIIVLPDAPEDQTLGGIIVDYNLENEVVSLTIPATGPVEVKAVALSSQRLTGGNVFKIADKVEGQTDRYAYDFTGAAPGRYRFHAKGLGKPGEGITFEVLLTRTGTMSQNLQATSELGNLTTLPLLADQFKSKNVPNNPTAQYVCVWDEVGGFYVPTKMLKEAFLGVGNRAPELIVPVSPKAGVRGQPLIIAIPRTTFNDRDNDTITLTAIGLPAGLSWNEADWQVQGTPTEIGSFAVTLIADDKHGGITSHNFPLGITDPEVVNTPPVVNTIAPISGKVGTSLAFIVQQLWFADPDGFAVFFDVPTAQIPAGLQRTQEDGRTVGFTGTPTTPGTYQIPVKATDFGTPPLSTTANLTLVITQDSGPLVLQEPVWDGATGALSVQVSGGNGSAIDYRITTPNIRDWGQSNQFTVPTQWRNGVSLTIEARQSGSVISRQFTTFSNSGNQPPVVQNPPATQSNTAGTFFTLTLPTNTAIDPEGQAVTYQALDLPAWLSFNPTSRVFGGTSPLGAANTTVTVVIRCYDPQGAFTTTNLLITITQPSGEVGGVVANTVFFHYDDNNDTGDVWIGGLINPSAGAVTVILERQDNVPMNGNNYGTQPWVSGQAVPTSPYTTGGYQLVARFYNHEGLGTGIPEEPIRAKIIQGTVVQTLTYDVASGSGLMTTSGNTNRAPVKNQSILFFSALAGQPLQGSVLTLPANKFTDPDGDALTYSMVALTGGAVDHDTQQNPTATEVALPSWITFNTNNLQISGTPPAGVSAVYAFRIRATDTGGLSATDDFRISVGLPENPPDNEGDPTSYYLGELTGLRLAPRPPTATGESAKNANYGFVAYQLLDHSEGGSERNQRAWFIEFRNRVNGRCKVAHFFVIRWDPYEKNLGEFNALMDTYYNMALTNLHNAGEYAFIGIASSRGFEPTRTSFINDSEAQKWYTGEITNNASAVQARYTLDYDIMKTGTAWWLSPTTFPGKMYRYYKHFSEAVKPHWLNGTIQGMSVITSTSDETAYTREFIGGVLFFTDQSPEMKQSYRDYFGLDGSVPYPYSTSNPFSSFNSELGRMAQYHRTHLLAARFATGCFAIYDVMPGVPLIPDYGGWFHDEAGAVGTNDPHLFFNILINEYMRPRYPTTTLRFIMKHNPFPTDDNVFGGLATAGVEIDLFDGNSEIMVIQDQDYIGMENGKIRGLNANELAQKNLDYMKKSGGNCASFLHGAIGGAQFDIALGATDVYCATPNRKSSALSGSDYGIVYHSPEQHNANPSSYRGDFRDMVNAASNNGTRRVRVKRAARIEQIDLMIDGSQRKARIRMSYPVAGVGKVQISISGNWVDVTMFESEYVAIVNIPSGFSEVTLRPENNKVAIVKRPLTGLTGSWVRKYYAFKSQLLET